MNRKSKQSTKLSFMMLPLNMLPLKILQSSLICRVDEPWLKSVIIDCGDTFLATRPLFLPWQALLAHDRFPTRPMARSLLPGRRCCAFPRHAPGEHSDRWVPFLKAVSTGATTLLSQAEGMTGLRGFRSIRVSPTMLRRLCSDKRHQHPTELTQISQRMLCFPRGDARTKRLLLYAGFSHRAVNTRLSQAATAAHRTDSDFPAPTLLLQSSWAWRELHFASASSAKLWALALSLKRRRAVGELVPLGPCFPGLHVPALGSHCQAKLSRATTLQQHVRPRIALYAHYHLRWLGLLPWRAGRLGD